MNVIKGRIVSELLVDGVDDARVESIINSMKEDGRFPGIDYADLERTSGFPHRKHLENMVYMARAYKIESSAYYRNDRLKEHLVRCLQFWTDHDFVEENWHSNQIVTPSNLADLMLLVGDELPEELVEAALPMVDRTHKPDKQDLFNVTDPAFAGGALGGGTCYDEITNGIPVDAKEKFIRLKITAP